MPGAGPLTQLPRHAERVQLVIPAADVLLTSARLPPGARRHAAATLAYAIEEDTAGDPDSNTVNWLGQGDGGDALAVLDRPGLRRWLDALDGIGIGTPEIHCETLFLDRAAGEWSLAWNGREGFLRTGELQGAATDCGERGRPPLSLRLALEETQASGAAPDAIAVYPSAPDAAPDVEAWQRELHVPVRLAGRWDWQSAAPHAGRSLLQERRRWRGLNALAERLRPAAWIAGVALAIHAVALAADWASLAGEQRDLRRQMEARFRAAFPDAVAVVDPALQMRRKLAEARHAAGLSDSGDFLPMIEVVAAGLKDLPTGSVRSASYENGRLTIELGTVDESALRRAIGRLRQAGFDVEQSTGTARTSGPGNRSAIISVRAL